MITIEYGKENRDVIMLLHGGGLSWWNYREVAEILQDKYHVIIPILNGHAGSDGDFVSIEDNAKKIIAYIDEVYGGRVAMIGGVSLGGQILVEMLTQRSDICRYAVIESALVIPMKLTQLLVKPMMDISYGLIKQEWFSKLQFRSLKIKKELYDDYYRDTCNITKENMTAFLQSNSGYRARKELAKCRAEVYIFVGGKESPKMLRSAEHLYEMMPDSVLRIFKKWHHGEFSINHAAEYADILISILEPEQE